MPGPSATNRAMLGIMPLVSTDQPAPMPVVAALPAPLDPSDEEQINSWLAAKAKTYPEGTPPERAAMWQDYDRQRYAEHLRQKREAEAQLRLEQDARQRVIDGFLAGLMPQR